MRRIACTRSSCDGGVAMTADEVKAQYEAAKGGMVVPGPRSLLAPGGAQGSFGGDQADSTKAKRFQVRPK